MQFSGDDLFRFGLRDYVQKNMAEVEILSQTEGELGFVCGNCVEICIQKKLLMIFIIL